MRGMRSFVLVMLSAMFVPVLLLLVYFLSGQSHLRRPQTCEAVWDSVTTQLDGVTCDGFDTNDACYGSEQIRVRYRPEVTPMQRFEMQGDVSRINVFSSISTSELDRAAVRYGVGLLRLEASLPGTMRGSPVTFVLYGKSELQPAASVGQPPTDVSQIIHMPAFYLSSGMGLSGQCQDLPQGDLPNGGLLIDTHGTRVRFTVNGVEVTLGSIAVLQATSTSMSISMLEGRAQVVVPGFGSQSAAIMQTVRVPLANNAPAGSPQLTMESLALLQQNYGLNTLCLLAGWAGMRPIPACSGQPLPTSTHTATMMPTSQPNCMAFVLTNGVLMRSGPGAAFASVGEPQSMGMMLSVLGTLDDSSGGRWYLVAPMPDQQVWVAAGDVMAGDGCENVPPAPTLTPSPTATLPPPVIVPTRVPPTRITPRFETETAAPTLTFTPTFTPSATPTHTPTQPVLPTADFRWSAAGPGVVQFSSYSFGDIVRYAWDFGDGRGGSTARDPLHLYNQSGSYTVTLTVFGAGGTRATSSQVVTVILPTDTPTPQISKLN